MTHELLVSTRRGLLIGRSEDRRSCDWAPTQFPGWQIDYAVRDPRHGRIWVAASHSQLGPHLHSSDDGGRTWDETSAPEFEGETYNLAEFDPGTLAFKAPRRNTASLARVWTLEPGPAEEPNTIYAGVDPAALFVSRSNGASWEICTARWDHPTREAWVPGAAGLALHHIQIDPTDPAHLYVAISAAGVFESLDGGASWFARNNGCRADHLPNPEPEAGQCVHSFHLHPAQPARLYQQHHPGVYRSDDSGAH